MFSRHYVFLTICVAEVFGFAFEPSVAVSKEPVTYEARLYFPTRVGTRERVTSEHEQIVNYSATKDAKSLLKQSNKSTIYFDVLVDTVKHSSNGKESQLEFEILKAVIVAEGLGEKTILPKGKKLLVTSDRDKKKETYLDLETKKELEGLALQLIPTLIFPGEPDATEEDVFGPPKPRRVGEKWKGDSSQAAKYITVEGTRFDAKDIQAEAEFLKITEKSGRKFLTFQMTITAKTKSIPDPPPNMKLLEARMKMIETLTVPADYSSPPVEQTLDRTVTVDLLGGEGTWLAGSTIIMESIEHRKAKIKSLKLPKKTGHLMEKELVK